VLAREQAAREREVRQKTEAELLARRQELVLGLALDERVMVLRRDEPVEAGTARDLFRGFDLLGGEVRGADPAHFAVVDEVVQRRAGIERGVDHGQRLLVVDPAAEVVRAEADDRDFRPALAEKARPHLSDATRSATYDGAPWSIASSSSPGCTAAARRCSRGCSPRTPRSAAFRGRAYRRTRASICRASIPRRGFTAGRDGSAS